MLQIEQVNKQYSTRILLKEATAHLRPHTRTGLVGPNGSGKTTLLRMILGEESPDEGTIRKRPKLKIGYLPQELETLAGKTVLDAAHRDLYPEHEAKRILAGLGFAQQDFERPIETLSGGYRMRVALAHLLLSNPDVLMLDEPTNHLDKPTQKWFEDFLINSKMTILVISHDTKFLDRIATHIWELRHQTIQEYRDAGGETRKHRWLATGIGGEHAGSTIGILHRTRLETGLPEHAGLLVGHDGGDRNGRRARQAHILRPHLAEIAIRRQCGRQQRQRHTASGTNLLVP